MLSGHCPQALFVQLTACSPSCHSIFRCGTFVLSGVYLGVSISLPRAHSHALTPCHCRALTRSLARSHLSLPVALQSGERGDDHIVQSRHPRAMRRSLQHRPARAPARLWVSRFLCVFFLFLLLFLFTRYVCVVCVDVRERRLDTQRIHNIISLAHLP